MPTLSLDTVYRAVATFEKLNLAHRLEIPENQARFVAPPLRHHHFFCDRCGQVIDFTWPAFETVALPPRLTEIGAVHRTNAVMYGRCATCLMHD